MTAICEQHLSTLKKLIKYLNTDANSWTKIADEHNLPELDVIKIDGATIYSWYRENEIVGSMCVKYLGQDLCEIVGDIDNIDQFVDTVDKLIKNIEIKKNVLENH
jgi:hypothetical protein